MMIEPSVGFGYEIYWGDSRYRVRGHLTPEAAKAACIAWATKNGWTPPEWWQFWRWNDTRP